MPSCTPALAAVAQEKCPTRPGLTTNLRLAFASELLTIGAATNHAVSTITAGAGDGFYTIACSRKDNDLKSTPNENGGYTTEVKYFVTKQDAAKAKIFDSINGVEDLVAIVPTQDGERMLVGSKDHPAMAKVTATVTPKNGYELVITWEEHANLPFHFTGTEPSGT